MTSLLSGRKFQVWSYTVSHGFLLIRSPASGAEKENIDIIFAGVEYMALPRHLGHITIDEPSQEEVTKLEKVIGKYLLDRKIAVLVSGDNRHVVVFAQIKIETNSLEMFEYPFELGGRKTP